MSNQQKILIASDHAGFALKEFLLENLQKDYKIEDLGCENGKNSVDYPDFADKAAKNIAKNRAILICGSGIGISMAANRHKNMRAALCMDEKMARLSRQHNDANALCLGARLISQQDALAITKTFLNTEFQGQRHEQRIKKFS